MSKIFNGIIGFIIGDAMGVATEFVDRKTLFENPVLDMVGYLSHNCPAGSWSDDTSMTICLMESIIDKKTIDYDDIMKRFFDWLTTGNYTPNGVTFDIGRTCLTALYNYEKGITPVECGIDRFDANGNGSLMRILPLAYYIYYKKITDEKDIIDLVGKVSSLTHAHQISRLGCYMYIRYILFLLEGKDKDESFKCIRELDYSFFDDEVVKVYDRILKGTIKKAKVEDVSSSGYVVDTLEAVFWMLFNTKSYEQAIIGAINLGNDTDTIAAICGSIVGIIYGREQIPDRWINALMKKDYLLDLIDKFEKVMKEL